MDMHPINKEVREEIDNHIARYLATDGEEGFFYRDQEHLILTTTGRKSGEPRSTPLIFGSDGDNYLIVASLGGYDKPPQWYLNLSETPEITVQIKADRFDAIARTASPEERPRLWDHMVEVFPTYAEYQENTDREIPVVILERA